jgi:hypothetical protein
MFSSIDEAWNNNLPIINKPIESFITESGISNSVQTQHSCDESIKRILSCPSCMSKIKFILSKDSSPLDKYIFNPINSLTRETKDMMIFYLFIIAFIIIIFIIMEQ